MSPQITQESTHRTHSHECNDAAFQKKSIFTPTMARTSTLYWSTIPLPWQRQVQRKAYRCNLSIPTRKREQSQFDGVSDGTEQCQESLPAMVCLSLDSAAVIWRNDHFARKKGWLLLDPIGRCPSVVPVILCHITWGLPRPSFRHCRQITPKSYSRRIRAKILLSADYRFDPFRVPVPVPLRLQ